MNIIEVNYKNIPDLEITDQIIIFCKDVLNKLNLSNWEISILICDDLTIKDLNNKFRSKNNATDVLSFNQDLVPVDDIIYAGDIVISIETVKLHSNIFSVPLNEELKRVMVHGILHLNGMDHASNSIEEKMLKLQESILEDISGELIN
ncbi:MAG: rRNA maturation RNase YbeY [Spirochaetales bacterium]|nr:rRNA maturation RNase YbeY [Spirochaetales bacterium]